jgi:hypothetical protein
VAGIRTIGRLTVINAVNTLLALLNTVIVAYYFGTGRPVEVYLAAAGLYVSLMSLAQTGQVSEILLPTYHQLRERFGAEVAFGAYTALVNRLLVLGMCARYDCLAALPDPGRVARAGIRACRDRHGLGDVPVDPAAGAAAVRGGAVQDAGQRGTAVRQPRDHQRHGARGLPRVTDAARRSSGSLGTRRRTLVSPCSSRSCGNLWLLRRRGYRYALRLGLPAPASHVRLFGKLAGTLPYVLLTQVYLFVLDAGLSKLAQGASRCSATRR